MSYFYNIDNNNTTTNTTDTDTDTTMYITTDIINLSVSKARVYDSALDNFFYLFESYFETRYDNEEYIEDRPDRPDRPDRQDRQDLFTTEL